MRILSYFTSFALATLMLASCSSFLNVKPDKSGNSDIYHMEQLVDLMGNSYMYYNSGFVWGELVHSSDDCEVTPYYYNRSGINDMSYGANIWNREDFDSPSMESCTWKSA